MHTKGLKQSIILILIFITITLSKRPSFHNFVDTTLKTKNDSIVINKTHKELVRNYSVFDSVFDNGITINGFKAKRPNDFSNCKAKHLEFSDNQFEYPFGLWDCKFEKYISIINNKLDEIFFYGCSAKNLNVKKSTIQNSFDIIGGVYDNILIYKSSINTLDLGIRRSYSIPDTGFNYKVKSLKINKSKIDTLTLSQWNITEELDLSNSQFLSKIKIEDWKSSKFVDTF